jgi:hypothetical protein
MRWFRIRKAKIDPELRNTFERYGVVSAQVVMATTNYFLHKGGSLGANEVGNSLLPWLTEQYDRAERKETWSLAMEVTITVFVVAELLFAIWTRIYNAACPK